MENFIVAFNEVLGDVNGFLWSKFLIVALIAVGLYFTFRTKFVQLRMVPEGIRVIKEGSSKEGLSSFQALMIATASRVGTGNIAGVATAIAVGGAGAVVWMWILAIIGGASAFVESTLAQIYKEEDGKIFKGGPAYYIQRALNARWLGIIFAILLILTFAFGFNGLQSYTIASSFDMYKDSIDAIFPFEYLALIVGTVLALISAFLFFGGAHKIGKVSSVLVPVMAIIYILIGLSILIMNIGEVPHVLGNAFKEAFDFQTIMGGFAGSCVVQGIKRGLFSNEAGMGSAPNAAASAEVSHPVKQGLVQVLSVFIDTLILCSTTVFIVLLSEEAAMAGGAEGITIVQQAVEANYGSIGAIIVTVSVILFAFTSVIGNYFYAEANIKFISENKTFMFVFKVLAVAMVFIGAQQTLSTAWNLADALMGFMATVNIIAMFLLGQIAVRALADYEAQKKEGKDPVFKASSIGLTDTDLWK